MNVLDAARAAGEAVENAPTADPTASSGLRLSRTPALASGSVPSRREEALRLAEELLGDLELGRATAIELARKTSRLARLLDDSEAMSWLRYEVGGYPTGTTLSEEATRAADRSHRRVASAQSGHQWATRHLGGLDADIAAARAELEGGAGPPSSSQYAILVERERAQRLANLRNAMGQLAELRDRILGAFHEFAAAKYQELRFGAAVESAFEVVRAEVDAAIADLVPDALPKLSAAFENTTSDNPEDWASAAATCRRLFKAAADALRPPGSDVNGRKMGEEQFINRLMDWVQAQAESETVADLVVADLAYLARRLDAAVAAGHKGAHAEVSRFDGSRFVTGTYLLLGDILRLRSGAAEPSA